MEDDDDCSDCDSEAGPPRWERIYSRHSHPLLLRWGLPDEETRDLLCQLAALHAYQSGDTLSEMVYRHYRAEPIAAQLEDPDLYYEIRGLGGLLALLFLDGDPAARALVGPALPPGLVAYLSDSAISPRRKLAVAECVLFQGVGGRKAKRGVPDSSEDRGVVEESVALLRQSQSGRRSFGCDPRADASLVFDFVRRGLQGAFANRSMQTTLAPGTVLYHGCPILDPNKRRNLRWKDRFEGRAPREFGRSFDEEISALERGPVSATLDVLVAYDFYKQFGYGSVPASSCAPRCERLSTPRSTAAARSGTQAGGKRSAAPRGAFLARRG